jgi:hypothetical protein
MAVGIIREAQMSNRAGTKTMETKPKGSMMPGRADGVNAPAQADTKVAACVVPQLQSAINGSILNCATVIDNAGTIPAAMLEMQRRILELEVMVCELQQQVLSVCRSVGVDACMCVSV